MNTKNNKKIHLINLYKWRSLIALVACLETLVLTSGSIIYGIINDSPEIINTEFQWFTVDSNIFMALASMMLIPFTIEGIQRKRLTYPKWAQLIHYAGVINTTLTLIFVLGFVSWYDPILAFGDENIILHIVSPLLVLIAFYMVESVHPLTRHDNIRALIPFGIYAILYIVNVSLGRWEDHYMLNTFVSFGISIPLVIILVYSIGYLIRIIHNKLLKYRQSKLKIIWSEDLDPVTIKIEVFSLGTHAGLYEEKDSITVPYDILEDISNKFNIKIEELAFAYNKGVVEGLKEKEKLKIY